MSRVRVEVGRNTKTAAAAPPDPAAHANQQLVRGFIEEVWNGRKLEMMTIHHIERGKIAEDWVLVESLGFFQQLGLIPPTFELFSRAKQA